MARIALCHQMLEISQGTDFPSELLEATLPISWFQISILQNNIFLLFLATKFLVALIAALKTYNMWPWTYENSRELHGYSYLI